MELAVGSRDATWKSAVPVLMGCLGGRGLGTTEPSGPGPQSIGRGALCVRGEHSASLLAVVLVLLGCTSRGVLPGLQVGPQKCLYAAVFRSVSVHAIPGLSCFKPGSSS